VGFFNDQNWTTTVGLRAFGAQVRCIGSAGVITGAVGYHVEDAIDNSIIDSLYGIRIEAQTGGITNSYGLWVDTPSGGSAENDAIHVLGGRSYFGGVVQVSGSGGSNLVNLTAVPTITTDASLGNTFTVTVTGSHTLANPTNLNDGFTYIWEIIQDDTGGRALGYDSLFIFPGGDIPSLTPTASGIDVLTGVKTASGLLCNMSKDYS